MTDNPNRKSHDMPKQAYNRHTLGMKRRHRTAIRVDRKLWGEFRRDVRCKGLTTCLVLDGLVRAWMYGASAVPGINTPQKIDIHVQKVVNVPKSQEGAEARWKKRFKGNHYSPSRGWYYDPELESRLLMVEQPKEWAGEEKGFRWVKGEQCWYKVEEKPQ